MIFLRRVRKSAGIALALLGAAAGLVACEDRATLTVRPPKQTATAKAGTLAAPLVARPPVVMFLGDSYTVGSRGVTADNSYAADAARTLGWQVVIAGRGGTGFVAPSAAGEPFPIAFNAKLAWRPAPDMLVISGGHNDARFPVPLVDTAARSLITRIRQVWPNTRLVLIGPLWGSGTPTPAVLAIRDALGRVAQTTGIPFIDPIAEQWVTGDRKNRTGNAAAFIMGDGVHPTREGHRYLATRLVADLRRQGLAQPRRTR